MKRLLFVFAWISVCLSVAEARQKDVSIVSHSPEGELSSLAQANEIRVVFSEPMVALGRIPDRVAAPFFKISPRVPGSFRWSGTTVLVFTPDPQQPLPFATEYEVSIAAGVNAVSGRRLAKGASFRFTTPTAKLLRTSWYRRGGTVDGSVVIPLRFNQPMRGADVLAALTAKLTPHPWNPPQFLPEEEERLRAIDPRSLEAFHEKVKTTQSVAGSTAPVQLRLATEWDQKRFPPSPDLVVLETVTRLEPESHLALTLSTALRSAAGRALPAMAQTHVVELEPAFFIDGFGCRVECDGDRMNALRARAPVVVDDFRRAVTATDITGLPKALSKRETPRQQGLYRRDVADHLTLEDAGYGAQPPHSKYSVVVDAGLKSIDGQTLGYTWLGIVDTWHKRAFTSFGDGHGVWEKGGGTLLPFYARNTQEVTQWSARVGADDLVPTIVSLQGSGFNAEPAVDGVARRLRVTPDRVQSHGLDLSKALGANGTGVVWAAVRDGRSIPRARHYGWPDEPHTRATLVQVTNLGITVKDSPQNTLIFVTTLDQGTPVTAARVSIVRPDNSVVWRGTTDGNGVAIAPDTPLRGSEHSGLWFVVVAEKDGDVAYVASDWNEGIMPWDFGTRVDLNQAEPLLTGTILTDRGVYRLGEEVHFKAVLRHNTPQGIRLLPVGTSVAITIRDSQYRVVNERTVKVNDWSSAEWTLTLPQDGALGDYSVHAVLTPPQSAGNAQRDAAADDEERGGGRGVGNSFLVAAYRRPDFRVDVTLSASPAMAGEEMKGVVTGRYLFGAPMGPRPVSWRLTAVPVLRAPSTVTDKFLADRWVFVGSPSALRGPVHDAAKAADTLGDGGEFEITFDTDRDAGVPYLYTLEGDVEDVSRQHIANRASLLVHPAPWYIGLRRPDYFLQQRDGLKTEVVAASIDGTARAGVQVVVTLTQIQWNSVRRAEGNGFYTWETERRQVPAGQWTVATALDPVPLHIPLTSGGYFVLEATARTEDGRSATTTTAFYALGEGYTAWERYDHNRIDLVPERQTYRPGETARLMIQSPWEHATALVTTEREGIRTHRQFALTSTQQAVDVPIREEDIPNVFVSVLLIKGRTHSAINAEAALASDADTSDPGKPAFRLGYIELKVEDRTKRLTVNVTANRNEYRPASAANVRVKVSDPAGRGARAELTLWAVDYGVLSLTDYRVPDIVSSVYIHKALQVLNADGRQRVVSRRVLTPKGATDGGGGGDAAAAGTVRKDFRVLAFWVGSVVTDEHGDASVDVKLPESLTTYRIMAIAADRDSRFGSGDTDIRTNKPLTLKPAYPRFLAVGDSAYFGAVVTNQLPKEGTAVVTMRSLDDGALQLPGPREQRVVVPAGGSVEVRFHAQAKAIGRARVQMTAAIDNESDAFEDVIPVEVLASAETVAAYGEATDTNPAPAEKLVTPPNVVPGFGGLQVQLASTALVGLSEGARYLVDYPFGCAEQKSSRALALLLAADLGQAFSLPGMDPAHMRDAVQATLKDLEKYQCSSGGFGYWPGDCFSVSPYLTAYVLHVLQVASTLGYEVDAGMRERAAEYLERELMKPPPDNESWWPSYTAWKAFAVKVLTESGRNADSTVTRLYGYRDRMPVFALAYLHDAMQARGETSGTRVDDLRRRMRNAILTEAGSAHVEELSDPYLLWFWNSNVRSTAIVLNSLVKGGVADAPFRPLVRWLMAVRKKGRWGNTQENAHAMQALVAYYRKYESVVPDFTAVVRLGPQELARERFEGRSTEARSTEVPMTALLATSAAGEARPLTFAREGAGTLFYTARLRYAADTLFHSGLDAGFQIARRYEPFAEEGTTAGPPSTSYKAGDLVRVTLTLRLTKERRFVAVTDPLPAGFEPVESWLATTARQLANAQDRQSFGGDPASDAYSWTWFWRAGGFDHVERHDDRVNLFATRLSTGVHVFSYVARATTAGTFRTAPARAEEMYEPEIFGRTETALIEVKQ